MKLKNIITTSFTVASLSAAGNVMAQPNENFCAEVAKCNEDKKPVKPRKTCSQEYEQGICLPDDLATSLLGNHASVTEGLCPGGEKIRCYDAGDAQNHSKAIGRLTREGIKLRKDHDALKSTVDNHINSNEHLHKVLGRALQPELEKLDTLKKFYEANCTPQTLDLCAYSIMNYEAATQNLVQLIRKNLLDTPENEKLRMQILIDNALHNYFKEDFDRTKKMIDENTVKLSFMPTLGYKFSVLNSEADSDAYHMLTPGVEACLYTPPELFGLCLTGKLFVGNSTFSGNGLGSEKIYNSSLPTFVDTQIHGEYSDVNTVETDINISRISYGSVGMTAKLGGFVSDSWKLSFLGSLDLELGREYTSTRTKGTSVLSFQDVPEDPRIVSDIEETDNLFIDVVPQIGTELCYDLGVSRSCAYGKMGPSFPTGDGKEVTFTGNLGFGTGVHF